MRCPACQIEIIETTEACPQCNFSLPALERVMGFAPSLKPDVTDMADELTGKELKMVRKAVARFQKRFPQVRCAVVASATPEKVSLPLYVFWLFNKGGLSSMVERGGANRLVLIVLDPSAQKLACMIGYGLEPFISEGRLAACLQAALPFLASDEPGAGLCACIQQLEIHLAEVAESLNQTFGLGDEYEHLEQLLDTGNAAALAY